MTNSRSTTEPPAITRPGDSRDLSLAQTWAEGGLAQHPYQIELSGAPAGLSWPRVCAHCGGAATEQVVVKKAFRPRPRRYGRSSGVSMRPYRITAAPIPFCGSCAAEHRATVQRPSVASKVMTMVLNPLIIPAVGAAWVASKVIESGVELSLAEPAGLLASGLVALMVATVAWSVFLMWQTTRASRLDPRTQITRSCDFSEDVSTFFETERRIYALANKAFADAFAAQNAERVWTERDQSRSSKLSFVAAVITLAVFAGLAALISVAER